MSKYFLLISFVAALVLISGCIQPTTPETLVCDDGTIVIPPDSCPPPGDLKIPLINLINIDGKFGDWSEVPVFIEDVEGDVRLTEFDVETEKEADAFEFDVTSVKFAHNKTHLFILIEFAKNLDYYFENNKANSKPIGTLFLDTDNSIDTGGKEFFSEVGGFESRIDIWSGVKTDGTSASGGAFIKDLPKDAELEYFINYYASEYDAKENSLELNFDTVVKSYEEPDKISYSGNLLEFKVPFQNLGINLSKSKVIKTLFSEAGSGSFGAGKDTFSEESVAEIE